MLYVSVSILAQVFSGPEAERNSPGECPAYKSFYVMRGLRPGKATFVFCPHARLGRAKNCIASYSTFSVVNMDISKSYLDLYLSESDWCRFVVEFGLSDLTRARLGTKIGLKF